MNKKMEVWKEKRHTLASICYILIILGIVLNFIAITSNNCNMPVYSENFKEKYVSNSKLFTRDKTIIVNFYFSDIFSIEAEDFYLFFSLGDLLVAFGCIFLFYIEILDVIKEAKYNNKNKRKLNNKRKHGK
jgi:hypothetical protein